MSAILLFSAFSFSACKKNDNGETETTAAAETSGLTKATTSKTVRIVDLPTSKEDQISMFNAALDFFDLYCYSFTKDVRCSVSNVSVGSLSSASNAVEAFKSVFGETETSNNYVYQTGQESFSENSMKSGFTSADVVLADVKQEDSDIILTVKFPNESNPSEKNGQLHKLTTEYLSAEKVKKNLSEFNSSAGSVNVSASDIEVTVVLNSLNSSLKGLTLSFTENFSLGSVKLVQLEGSSVTGTSKTTVSYSNIK